MEPEVLQGIKVRDTEECCLFREDENGQRYFIRHPPATDEIYQWENSFSQMQPATRNQDNFEWCCTMTGGSSFQGLYCSEHAIEGVRETKIRYWWVTHCTNDVISAQLKILLEEYFHQGDPTVNQLIHNFWWMLAKDLSHRHALRLHYQGASLMKIDLPHDLDHLAFRNDEREDYPKIPRTGIYSSNVYNYIRGNCEHQSRREGYSKLYCWLDKNTYVGYEPRFLPVMINPLDGIKIFMNTGLSNVCGCFPVCCGQINRHILNVSDSTSNQFHFKKNLIPRKIEQNFYWDGKPQKIDNPRFLQIDYKPWDEALTRQMSQVYHCNLVAHAKPMTVRLC
jgi:hypothetical protein